MSQPVFQWSAKSDPGPGTRRRETLVAAAAAVALVVATATGQTPSLWGVALVAWLAAWVIPLTVVGRAPGRSEEGPWGPPWRLLELTAWAALLLVAAVLRTGDLAMLPFPLHNDAMSCGLEARRFLGSGEARGLFTAGWYFCPSLGFFLTSLPMRLFGDDLIGLRMGSVVLGLASLVGGGLLVRALFGRVPALLWLVLTVPYHWHLQLSRSGHHYVQAVAATVWVLALTVAAARTRRPVWLAGAGVVLGIGLQTYYAVRLVPLLLVVWAAAWAASGRAGPRLTARAAEVVLGFALLVVAPLLPYYLEHPRAFGYRTDQVLVLGDQAARHVRGQVGSASTVDVLVHQAARTAELWTRGGDTSMQYGFRGAFMPPVLWPAVLLGGVIGAVAVWRLRRRGATADRVGEVPPGLAHLLVWLWLGGTLVAGGVLTVDAPFSPRLSGISTAVMILPAIGLAWLVEQSRRIGRRTTWAVVVVVTALAVVVGASSAAAFRDPARRQWPPERRDLVVRWLADHPGVRSVLDLTETPETFGHEAYAFMAPGVEGVVGDPGGDPVEQVAAVPRPLLVLLPDPGVERLAAAFPGAVTGRFAGSRIQNPCAWVLVE